MQIKYDQKLIEEYIENIFNSSALPSLCQFIKIPNLSRNFDPQWQTNGLLEQAAQHIKKWIQTLEIQSLTTEIIKIDNLSPIIFTEIKGDLPETIFFYGHYDKQPAFTGWFEGLGALIPIIKDNKLYGRGGADDGYATYGSMIAIKALQHFKIPIPRCIMITQGDQQSGSGHIQIYIKKLKDRIGNPTIFFCLDSGSLDYDRFWITNSLRGVLMCNLKINVLKQAIHSGDASGIVPSSFRILQNLLQKIQQCQNGQMNQCFLVDIPANRYKQMYELSQIKKQQSIKQYPFIQGAKRIKQNILSSLINRGWKSQISIIGLNGIPSCQNSSNIMLPNLQIKLSIRLPPIKNCKIAQKEFIKLITNNVPYNAKVTISNMVTFNGFNAPQYSKLLEDSLNQASNLYYGKPKLAISQGLSIPFMNLLKDLWPNGQFVISGLLGPQSNAHGPNQFLHLPYCKKLICCMSYILAKISMNHTKK